MERIRDFGLDQLILERRDAWTRIRVPSGTSGWVPGGAVEPVTIRWTLRYQARQK